MAPPRSPRASASRKVFVSAVPWNPPTTSCPAKMDVFIGSGVSNYGGCVNDACSSSRWRSSRRVVLRTRLRRPRAIAAGAAIPEHGPLRPLLRTPQAAAVVAARIEHQDGWSAASEESLWRFPSAEAQRQARGLLGRREFVMKHADVAMYRAKVCGNRYCFYRGPEDEDSVLQDAKSAESTA